MNVYVMWEARDNFDNPIGWFTIETDAKIFVRGLDLPSEISYPICKVNKLVKEND